MPKVGGKEFSYDADGIVKARAAAIQVVQNPDKHSKKELAEAQSVIAQYAKEQDMKRDKNHPANKEKRKKPATPKAPPSRPKMMYGGMANKRKHNYVNGGSVIDNLTPAQKNMVKKMAAANKK